ncbi:hypothetical protein D3C85_1302650 [compost metagenome]
MTQRPDKHGPGIVIFQPAGVGGEHAALLDGIAELEEAIVLDFQHPDHAELVVHFGQHTLYALSRDFVLLLVHHTVRQWGAKRVGLSASWENWSRFYWI